MNFTESALIIAWIAIALLAFVVAGLLRQVHELTRRPTLDERALGRTVDLDLLGLESGPADLVFVDASCGLCKDILMRIAGQRFPNRLSVYYADAAPQELRLDVPVMEHALAAFRHIEVPSVPWLVRLNEGGKIAHFRPLTHVTDIDLINRESAQL
jgi:hypothetical protein